MTSPTDTCTLNPSEQKRSPPCSTNKTTPVSLIGIGIFVWAVLIYSLAYNGNFQDPPGLPPLSIFWANVVPISLFAMLYWFNLAFKNRVLALDLSLLTSLHAMRTIGFSFLVLADMGQLPWLFAIPTGFGDIFVAISAPFIAYKLSKNADFISSTRFLTWTIFGIVDFLVAIATGSISRVLGPGVVGAGMGPIDSIPMVLIPAFLVPLMMLTHIVMVIRIIKARKDRA